MKSLFLCIVLAVLTVIAIIRLFMDFCKYNFVNLRLGFSNQARRFLQIRRLPLTIRTNAMPRTKGKGKREEMTNIKVTKETHDALQVAASLAGMTQSEVIALGLNVLFPNLPEELRKREVIQKELAGKKKLSSNN